MIRVDLDTRLEKLKKHEAEIIQRVAELKEEQVDLKNKRENVLKVEKQFFTELFINHL